MKDLVEGIDNCLPGRRRASSSPRRASVLKERSAAQSHFIDLCRMLGEPTPTDADPAGEWYCFERGARKDTGSDGWAHVERARAL